ncbi:MAG: zinc-dependent peptidase [Planctomycetales bacterium]|nr:zinc-dependent peptidase [Planctomycetales bacterium]
MWQWWRGYRRRILSSKPLPEGWETIISHAIPFYELLTDNHRKLLGAKVQCFVAEKNWEGCNGLKLHDLHRVSIATQMAVMTLGLALEYFDKVLSILVYPTAYVAPARENVGGMVLEYQSTRAGEAWAGGPVIVAWDELEQTIERRLPSNVVIHEFAHQLDMQNGAHADGVPVLESVPFAERWLEVMHRDRERLASLCSNRQPSILDCYGASNQAEFFAVCSETFFQAPYQLKLEWPEVYDLLSQFYNLDWSPSAGPRAHFT